jgi:HlyD family secretion protein
MPFNSIRRNEMKPKSLAVELVLILWLLGGLAACSAFGGGAPTALPTIVLDETTGTQAAPRPAGGGVTASGLVKPAQEAQIASGLAGRVESVNVAVGDKVTAGQALVQLEGQENLEAAVSAAQFELEQAQQALEDLNTEAETARVQAMQEIITYERAVRDAQYVLDNFTVPANQADLDTVEALNQMKQRLDQARLAFEPYKYWSETNDTREDYKEKLDEAQADYNAAVKRLQYEYDLEVVGAKLAKALRDYETLKTGPDPDQLRLAEARQTDAQNQLAAAQAALDRLTLTAPFAGTIGKLNVHSGEWVTAAQPILVLVDLDNLQVETTDLSERDISGIEIGQPVTVFVEALSQTVPGQVIAIAPLAEILGGDVVYKTTLALEGPPPGLRAGMSVEVRFGDSP